MGQVGAKMAILRPFGEPLGAFLVVLGAILKKIAKVENRTIVQRFCGLGGSGWRLLGRILGDLGDQLGSLGQSWREVGNFLARCWD